MSDHHIEALADVLLASWTEQGGLTPPFDTDRDDARKDARAILTSPAFRALVAGERAAAWDQGHNLGEALAYNAVGDILWERHHDVIGRADYRERRAARVETLPHWDRNPYRETP